MADRTVQELGEELSVLAYGYREERFGRSFHRISTERPDGSCLELVSKADALKQIHAIAKRLSAAEAKLADVEKDAARLEWADSQIKAGGAVWFLPSGAERFVQVRTPGEVDNFPVADSLRAAIDAAMQQGADK